MVVLGYCMALALMYWDDVCKFTFFWNSASVQGVTPDHEKWAG